MNNTRYIVYALFFASGISGLMYEVVWLRMLSRITGVTTHATATVVAAFMAGLALGSFLFGRFIDRREDGLRVYAGLEFLVACVALVIPFVLTASIPLYGAVYRMSGESQTATIAVRAVVNFVLLMLPTTLMGGTLPVLTSCLAKKDTRFGRDLSMLYGLNTLGAVLGVVVSGFITIGALGEQATIMIAAAVNLLVALCAYVLFRREPMASLAQTEHAALGTADRTISPYPDGVRAAVLVAFALSGFTALAYEVIWTRQLILFLETSIYAFSGMLAIFLIGIALGSISVHRTADRLTAPLAAFGVLELLVGLLSVANLYLFAPLDGEWAQFLFDSTLPAVAAFFIVFPMTFLFGLIFPVAASCYTKSIDRAGASVGRLYGFNTVGSILGSLLAGFFFIPVIGSTNTVIILACVNVVLGLVLIGMEPRRTMVRAAIYVPAVIGFVALTFGSIGKDPFLSTLEGRIFGSRTPNPSRASGSPRGTTLHYHSEAIEGSVTAFTKDKVKHLWINGIGMTYLCTETKLMAYLPLLFAKDPKEFLVICFGMGTTVRSAALNPGLNVTAVELVQETFHTFKYFHPDAEEVLKKQNVRLVTNDGRNLLLFTSKKYDVIFVDPAPPIYSAGTVNLYTREFFQLCKDRLTQEGVMFLWFPGGRTEEDLFAIVRTFREVFENTTVWNGPSNWGFYFIAPMRDVQWQRFEVNVHRLFSTAAAVKDLREYDRSCVTPMQLYRQLLLDKSQVDELRMRGALITDDYPFTEGFPLRELWKGKRLE